MLRYADRGTRMGKLAGFCAALALLFVSPANATDDPQAAPAKPKNSKPGIHYTELGKTGIMVADIGIGAGALTEPAVAKYALDQGLNFFDTAESYIGGRSEEALGKVAAERRDEMVICTKMVLGPDTTQDEILQRFGENLKRLQTTFVDVLMIHGGSQGAIDNPEVWKAYGKLKQEGKIRAIGISHHGPGIVETLSPLIAAGKVDVILCSYDPTAEPGIDAMLKQAREKGIGLVGMKILVAARKVELPEFESGDYPFNQAAYRWALKNSGMDVVIPSVSMFEQVDEYVAISGAGAE